MKFATAWWGVQLLAETKSEKELLEELSHRLPELHHHDHRSYENAESELLYPEEFDEGFPFHNFGFGKEELRGSKCVLEITR